MAADLPENYEGHPAFQFIRDVAVDWEQTKVINGEVGDYITVARQERGADRWFIGSVTDENARELTVRLDFLEKGKKYQATMYVDALDAHWNDNPTAYDVKKVEVDSNSELQLKLAPGGGAAISILPL
jgi:hypothetical protein